MELFPASNKSQWEIIKKVIDESDFYLLIIAGRYGSIGIDDFGNKVGYTEMEFDYATKTNKPSAAVIHVEMLPTLPSALGLSFGERTRAGIMAVPQCSAIS